jgi:hypothetical protein
LSGEPVAACDLGGAFVDPRNGYQS